MKLSSLSTFAALCMALAIPAAQAQSGNVTTDTHTFHEITDGVYFVVGTGSLFVQSNAMLVVNEDHSVVVDSHVTPDAAEALIKSVKHVTKKPIRYLINSHYHFDHAHGNQVFPDSVEIIGHEYTRTKLLGNVLEQTTARSFIEAIPGQIAAMREQLSSVTDPTQKAALKGQIAIQQAHNEALKEVVPTPPTITMRDKMTLFDGGREIQLLHLGKGHTAGDVVIFLPKERVVFTGDLMLPFLAYGGDGYVDEWVETLERLKALPFDLILPGHGGPITDKEQITHFQNYLRDLWAQVTKLKEQGVTFEDASNFADLTAHRGNYSQITEPGADPRAVRRIYQIIDAQ